MTTYVIITGASSGIGEALALHFARSNFHIIAIGRNEIALQRIKAAFPKGNITLVTADLSELKAVAKVTSLFKKGDNVRFLIHCAATAKPYVGLIDIKPAELQNIMNVNVNSALFLTQCLKAYFDQSSRVLFMSSDYVGTDKKLWPYRTSAYSMSKSALVPAVKYLQKEYSSTPLVGILNPGPTATSMFKEMKAEITAKYGFFKTTSEPAQPSDIAKFIYDVLMFSNPEDYCNTNWDYRDETQSSRIALSSDNVTNRIRSAL